MLASSAIKEQHELLGDHCIICHQTLDLAGGVEVVHCMHKLFAVSLDGALLPLDLSGSTCAGARRSSGIHF